MLVVRLEVWPGGRPHRIREIGLLRVGNISDLADVSDYQFVLEGASNERLGIKAVRASGEVRGHSRSDSAWTLVQRILDEAFPDHGPHGTAFGDDDDEFDRAIAWHEDEKEELE